ncbi:type IV conjugative transfer system lipoprotein TraV [Fangia hongkongensis]|uniref:type IV conjugative transfer system lipoprotein TraV n=1 Tax=Fangia hongkongensis TaxID=270495 RepID=UPI000367F9C2|nr:type IV conjugative transfer system lipoprotein TraV [Fangia hongkongensis]MBK2123761.1 type IV conjugative transfer system lipoprotein TraV [Fangia hongkongensis]
MAVGLKRRNSESRKNSEISKISKSMQESKNDINSIYQILNVTVTIKWARKLMLGFIGLGVLLLSGCAAMNGNFNCDKIGGLGAGCVSMNDVYKNVQNGRINANSDLTQNPIDIGNSQNTKAADAKTLSGVKLEIPAGFTRAIPNSGQPERTSDHVKRIWIAPFKDRQDNYHDASYVYTVVTPSHWRDYPVSVIRGDGFGSYLED